ncbi:replication protein A 70 kDa DNA-binding subunit E-like [Lolium rigidum]|uniref:replication protein A 70 kDa DNA-binding subunit E-like n=1 Tax=Lolium rigidum TaxID=89674 RepID=UPI001F5DB1C0|nr:replication protein A 70 kDa DNA-binding subunit E-like [Lolium rigidum]
MGSAEDEFTPLSQLTDETGKCKVRVRISRIWESFNPKYNIFLGLDSLLIDDQGGTMQARVLPNDIKLFEERLVEGKVYALSNFTVEETDMSCSNEWIMYFREQTVVNEIEGDIDSIPLHSFEFVNFKDLRSRRDNNSLMTDVLGHIVHVGKLQKFKKKSRHIQTCDATIRNLSGRELSVTLFGDIACGFAEDILEKGLEASVVAVFAGMRVDSYNSHLVCSTASSKYYLDLDIPEVQDFRLNLRIQQANPVPKKSEAQKLAESWRTIEQLKGLDREEYDDDTKFLCRVSLIYFDCTSGWCYPGCEFCYKSLGKKYRCSRCGPVKKPIQMYKLKAKVRDNTGIMNLMIFCEVAEKLVGVSAEKLVDEIKEDDDWYTLPKTIANLLGSTHTFQVFDKYGNGSFSVWWIMDHVSVPVAVATTGRCTVERVLEDRSPSSPTTVLPVASMRLQRYPRHREYVNTPITYYAQMKTIFTFRFVYKA